jgi:hypothetical protein
VRGVGCVGTASVRVRADGRQALPRFAPGTLLHRSLLVSHSCDGESVRGSANPQPVLRHAGIVSVVIGLC